MKSELIVDVQSDEIAIALTEDDRLQEINREKRDVDNFAVGNIYYGRVKKVMPALNAAFVDVGHEKEAFLHYLDLGSSFVSLRNYVTKAVSDRRKIPTLVRGQGETEVGKDGQISSYLKVGDMLLVQVIKEPINSKGPRLTAEINIAGRNMVLIPYSDKVMISQKIRRESERGRLKQLLQAIKPQGFGIIVRTVAEDKRSAELDNELKVLVRRWDDTIHTLQHPKESPYAANKKDSEVRLVNEELGRTIGIIRDVFSTDFTSIQVNDKDVYEEVKQYIELIAPDSAKIVKHYHDSQPIFDHFDITRQMKTGLGRTVGFKNGGYLIIDKTEALFAIDVNSGSKKLFEDQEQNAFQFNMLAADEIVHQLRLRDIGGIIIIDFIDMDDKDNQQKLYEHVRQLMARDRAKHNVLPLSKFGLMQITRQRVRPAVEVDVTEVCPMCMGKGKVQPTILFTETIESELEKYVAAYGKDIRLELHPYVYAYVSKGWIFGLKAQWKRKFGVSIAENQGMGMIEMRFLDKKGNKLTLSTAKQENHVLHLEPENEKNQKAEAENAKKRQDQSSQKESQPLKESQPSKEGQPIKEDKPTKQEKKTKSKTAVKTKDDTTSIPQPPLRVKSKVELKAKNTIEEPIVDLVSSPNDYPNTEETKSVNQENLPDSQQKDTPPANSIEEDIIDSTGLDGANGIEETEHSPILADKEKSAPRKKRKPRKKKVATENQTDTAPKAEQPNQVKAEPSEDS